MFSVTTFPVIFTEFCFLKRAHFSYHPCILEILTAHTFNLLTFYSIQGIIHLYYLLKIYGKLTFLTPCCVSGGRKCYFFRKILRTYYMHDLQRCNSLFKDLYFACAHYFKNTRSKNFRNLTGEY